MFEELIIDQDIKKYKNLQSLEKLIKVIFYTRGSQMVGRDPKVGRGTRIFNIRLYESSKI
jgi:hypothetical protein